MNENRELELSPATMRAMAEEALRRIISYVESLPAQPAVDLENAAEVARELVEPLPASGQEFDRLIEPLFERWIPKGYNTAGPGYLAYIPGGGLFHTAIADFIADAVNRYVGVWAAAPALAQLESTVTRWFSEIVGYPASSRGLLTTGGSMANFIAIATARRNRLPDDFLSGIIYTSDQVHHSVVKAALLAGFPESNIRTIPSDSQFRIRLNELREAICHDRKKGLTPFLIAASAGTTNTGAVDPLEQLSDISATEGLWLHADAAYGGFFMLTRRGRQVMAGLDRADSITLDPHKGLFLPYGTGSLLVRDGKALKRAHEVSGHYMPPLQADPEFVDFCLYSPELSRDFRGLRVWLPFKMHGIGVFSACLEEKLDLARWAAEQLAGMHGIEIVAAPQLSIVAFRLIVPGASLEETNDLNRRLLNQVNSRRRVYLTSTLLSGRFVLRICVLHFRTHLERVRDAVEDITDAIKRLQF